MMHTTNTGRQATGPARGTRLDVGLARARANPVRITRREREDRCRAPRPGPRTSPIEIVIAMVQRPR